jgi:hypothetical protein
MVRHESGGTSERQVLLRQVLLRQVLLPKLTAPAWLDRVHKEPS